MYYLYIIEIRHKASGMVSRRKAKRDEQSQTCKPYDKSSKIALTMVGYNDRLARITNAAK